MEDSYEKKQRPDLMTGRSKEQFKQMIKDFNDEMDIMADTLRRTRLTLDSKTQEAEKAMRVIKVFIDIADLGKLMLEEEVKS
jgi:hypothetical protein